MADRAQYLARTLLNRLAQADDVGPEPLHVERERRVAMIEKVLAVELGVTDGATISLVETALPLVRPRHGFTDREVATLADFLRERLSRALAET